MGWFGANSKERSLRGSVSGLMGLVVRGEFEAMGFRRGGFREAISRPWALERGSPTKHAPQKTAPKQRHEGEAPLISIASPPLVLFY